MYIKRQVFKGLAWSMIDKGGLVLMQLFLEIFLARLLTPNDYGTMAVVTVLIALGLVFAEGGFTNALINKQNRTDADMSTAFYCNIIIAVFVYVLLFTLAPYLSKYFGDDRLTLIIRILSVTIILNAATIIHKTIITIKLDYKIQSFITFAGLAISGAVAIYLAKNGFGVWSLVTQSLILNLCYIFLYYIFIKWLPNKSFSLNSFKHLIHFGSNVLFASVIQNIYYYSYNVFIAKFVSTTSLGIYNKSNQFTQMPVSLISSTIQRVSYPYFCSIQEDNEKVYDFHRLFTETVALIFFPLMVIVASVAEPFTYVFLTDKWAEIIPILKILSFAFILYPIMVNNMMLFQVKNKSSLFLRIEIISKLFAVCVLLLTIRHGLASISIGILISLSFQFLLSSWVSSRMLGKNMFAQLKSVLFYLILGILLFLLASFVGDYMNNTLLKIILISFLVLSLYAGIYYLFKRKTIRTVFNTLKLNQM